MTPVRTAGAATLLVLALAMPPAAAMAQAWQAYAYPSPGFAVQFPAPPDVEQDTFKTAAGASLPMTRYVLRQDGVVYSVEVIDYSAVQPEKLATIAEAEKRFGTQGKVTVAIDARINREFGRELSVVGDDGSRSTVAIFFVSRHLVELVAKALPPDPLGEVSIDAWRATSSPPETMPELGAEPAFAEPWQAQSFALTLALHVREIFTWAERADALGDALQGAAVDGSDYYERWLTALEALLVRKEIASAPDIAALAAAWQRAAEATPHGEAIVLENDPKGGGGRRGGG